MLLNPWSWTPKCEIWLAITVTVFFRPISRNCSSPVASNCSSAEPNWNPWVHSVHPREVYFPRAVNTGVPAEGFQVFSRSRIFSADSSNNQLILGSSFRAVNRWSILMGMAKSLRHFAEKTLREWVAFDHRAFRAGGGGNRHPR